MKAVDNPITKIWIEDTGKKFIDSHEPIFEVKINIRVPSHAISGDYDACFVCVGNSNKEYAERFRDDLLEKFGIKVEVKKTKIKSVTFAEMIVEK